MPHTGPVIVRPTPDGVHVLCPLGHLVTAWRRKHGGWAGSWIEAKIASHQINSDWIVTCHGADPNDPRP